MESYCNNEVPMDGWGHAARPYIRLDTLLKWDSIRPVVIHRLFLKFVGGSFSYLESSFVGALKKVKCSYLIAT